MGSGIRDLVVADWSMRRGACAAQTPLACTLLDNINTLMYPVQCSVCPDCPTPLNAFTCDITAAGIATNTTFEVVLEDRSTAYCKVSSANFATANCEKTCPVPPDAYCGVSDDNVSCQVVQGNGGVVNDLSCECPVP